MGGVKWADLSDKLWSGKYYIDALFWSCLLGTVLSFIFERPAYLLPVLVVVLLLGRMETSKRLLHLLVLGVFFFYYNLWLKEQYDIEYFYPLISLSLFISFPLVK